jgi:hypothetical protein
VCSCCPLLSTAGWRNQLLELQLLLLVLLQPLPRKQLLLLLVPLLRQQWLLLLVPLLRQQLLLLLVPLLRQQLLLLLSVPLLRQHLDLHADRCNVVSRVLGIHMPDKTASVTSSWQKADSQNVVWRGLPMRRSL